MASDTSHTADTIALAKKESAEHMEGLADVFQTMRQKPLIIRAHPLDASVSGPNVKTVHFVRHGQGFHNLLADMAKADGKVWENFVDTPDNPYMRPELLDSPLTHKGRQQALASAMTNPPELVVVSPACRALATGVLVFAGAPNILAHELVREGTGIHACDQRRPTSQQAREFPQVDFSMLTEEDELFDPHRRETKPEVAERIYQFLEWLSQRSEREVGVASHSEWLLTVFNGVCECNDESLKAWFQTGELRSVQLEFVTKA